MVISGFVILLRSCDWYALNVEIYIVRINFYNIWGCLCLRHVFLNLLSHDFSIASLYDDLSLNPWIEYF